MRRLVLLIALLGCLLPAVPSDAYTITSFVLRGTRTASIDVTLTKETWLRQAFHAGSGAYQGGIIQRLDGTVLYAGIAVRGITPEGEDQVFSYGTGDTRFPAGTRLRFTLVTDGHPAEFRWAMFLAGRTRVHTPKRVLRTDGGIVTSSGGPVDAVTKPFTTGPGSLVLMPYVDLAAPLVGVAERFCVTARGDACLTSMQPVTVNPGRGFVVLEAGQHATGQVDAVFSRVVATQPAQRRFLVLSVG